MRVHGCMTLIQKSKFLVEAVVLLVETILLFTVDSSRAGHRWTPTTRIT